MTIIVHHNSLHGDTATFTRTDPAESAPNFMDERRAWLRESHGLPPVLQGATDEPVSVKADPWVVVGTTTIDGDAQTIADAFGLRMNGLSACLHGIMEGQYAVRVGGRDVIPIDADFDADGGGLVYCKIVRRQSEIDAERFAEALRAMPTIADDPCPECGPHGNAGRVCLASTWVACTVCADGKPGDAFGAVEQAALHTDDDIRAGLKMADEAMPGVVQEFTVTVNGRDIKYPPGILVSGQVILDDGKTVATYVDGREVSRRRRF